MTDTPTFLQEPVPTGLAEYEATAREFVKELHPLAQAFPVVTGTAFEEIKASIREHGQIHAIHHRLAAGSQGLKYAGRIRRHIET